MRMSRLSVKPWSKGGTRIPPSVIAPTSSRFRLPPLSSWLFRGDPPESVHPPSRAMAHTNPANSPVRAITVCCLFLPRLIRRTYRFSAFHAILRAAARMFARHQTQVRHQLPRAGEPPIVAAHRHQLPGPLKVGQPNRSAAIGLHPSAVPWHRLGSDHSATDARGIQPAQPPENRSARLRSTSTTNRADRPVRAISSARPEIG